MFDKFRPIADFIHSIAILILLYKLIRTKSCSGISLKSQFLIVLVFTCRYLDLILHVDSYNYEMKLFFLITTYATIFLILQPLKSTYDQNYDTFRIEFLLVPSFIMALIFTRYFDLIEIFWTFSIFLESVAMLPQFFMTLKIGVADFWLLRYLIAMGLYRAFYILNWIQRYVDPEHHFDPISVAGGVFQTLGYIVFFYCYRRRQEKKLPLYFTNNTIEKDEQKYVKALLCSANTLDPEILDESGEIDAGKLAQKNIIVVQLKEDSTNFTSYLTKVVKKVLKKDELTTIPKGLTVKEVEDSLQRRPYIENIIQANNQQNVTNFDDHQSKDKNNLIKNTFVHTDNKLEDIKTLNSFKIPLNLLEIYAQKQNSQDFIQIEEFTKLIESNLYSYIVCLIKK